MQAASPFTTLRGSLAALHHEGPEPSPLAAGGSAPLDLGMAQQMQDLAKQLSMQMEYNSELLAQMQQLEEQQLAHHRDAQDKQAALRQALGTVDGLRAEMADLKRKVASTQVRARSVPRASPYPHTPRPPIVQDAAKGVSDEAQQVRVDNGVLRRQLDALEKLALEAKADIAGLRAERESLSAALAAAQKEAKTTQRALADAEAEAGARIGQLAGQNAALLKEVADMRSRVAPALAEAEAARGALAKLTEDVDEARRGRADALARLERAGAGLAAQEAALAEAKAQELRLVRALEEEHARGAALTAAALQARRAAEWGLPPPPR